MRSGAIKMLIPFREALERYQKNKNFCLASVEKQKYVLRPYQVTDQIQEELLNLDVVEISDTGKPSLKVSRRNAKIQKDFFSAFSYLVYGVHEYIEMPYYSRKAKARKRKKEALMAIQQVVNYNTDRRERHF